ncbi:MAG: ABC transporter ATP-binding protein [Rhodobiaceae bacterium]|nr:ABC transporter ATP-binding protein [Rhodobiaceae bacterium]MCC0055156.1 ABC transporter ATP-binding protein [Rhodobiaceae bacterium]
MLVVRGLRASYGASPVLHDVDLDIGAGEVVALMGRNGMGKTTTIRALMGLLKPSAGSLVFRGRELSGLAPFQIAGAGIGLVPEGRQIFPRLSVEENLVATARPGRWDLASVYSLFPALKARRSHGGTRISGGEQQMLAIGRALMTNPELLVLDEATEGLAPLLRADIWHCLASLKQHGQAILVVDKHVGALARIADRFTIMEKGVTVWTGGREAFVSDPAIAQRYLGV